ncbi:Sensor protein ZraS [Fundidesulfovibrio magnetotacticus]|uniref:histidine kinase n=1 Tax=Fundidesulfovibrio magnetotacticus TaxID=2730080 RepID=A0A6V8LW89_9BACT|nr:ATP-binding protein [Fundidesulfovibrio magnetotacticus]GFK94076.1 Sensor protein ZraS [Fundidesulfovibrio magnetotacticus]
MNANSSARTPASPGLSFLLAAGLVLAAAIAPMPWAVAPAFFAALAFWRARKNLAERLERSESQKCALDEQLFQSQKLAAIGEVASGIAHEINNPLAVITQESEWLGHLLAQERPPLEEARQSLAAIQTQVNRCADITHNLLNLARTWKPIRQPADLNRLTEDMARLAEREALAKHVSLARNYQENIPRIPLDPPLYRQAILNLLVNAVQAAGENGRVAVSTGWDPDRKHVFTRVEDDGPGIRPEHLGRIFDPFFTTKSPGKGTGLGLSITHRIVDRLGGRITAASPPGHGAVFTITLPLDNTENAP